MEMLGLVSHIAIGYMSCNDWNTNNGFIILSELFICLFSGKYTAVQVSVFDFELLLIVRKVGQLADPVLVSLLRGQIYRSVHPSVQW